MNFNDEQIIVDFIEGNLSPNDTILFKNELKINELLNSEVEDYKKAIMLVNQDGRNKLRKKINEIADNKTRNLTTNNQKTIIMNKKKNNKSIFWSIAAGLALLVIGYNFVGNNKKPEASKVFADNYQQSSNQMAALLTDLSTQNLGSRGVNPEGDEEKVMYRGVEISAAEFVEIEKLRRDTLIMGLKYFKNSDWLKSKQLLHGYTENYKTPVTDYATALYHLAKTSLNTDLYKNAIPVFDEYLSIAAKDDKLVMTAEWERALCYLNVDEKKASMLFDDMAQNNQHDFQDEAKAILAYFE